MMNDYEYLISSKVYEKLIPKLKGKVTVYVDYDTLFIKVTNDRFHFQRAIPDFSHIVCNGFDTDLMIHEFICEYKRHIINYELNKYFKKEENEFINMA